MKNIKLWENSIGFINIQTYFNIVGKAATVATLCNLSQISSITLNIYVPNYGYTGNIAYGFAKTVFLAAV